MHVSDADLNKGVSNSFVPNSITPPPTMLTPSVEELRVNLAAQGYSQYKINQMVNSYMNSGWQSINTGGVFVPIGDFNPNPNIRIC